MSIAPKLRAKQRAPKASTDTRDSPKASMAANGVTAHPTVAQNPKVARPACTLRLLPQRFIPASVSTNPDDALAFVSYKTLLALYPERSSGQKLHGWKAAVRRVAPPANPDKETSSAIATPPAPRVLVPNAESSTSKLQPTASSASNEVTAVWSPDVPVPDGHVILSAKCDNAEDWDLVR